MADIVLAKCIAEVFHQHIHFAQRFIHSQQFVQPGLLFVRIIFRPTKQIISLAFYNFRVFVVLVSPGFVPLLASNFTDNLRASMKTIVADYLKRWSIETLIKDEKQHLGLGDYRVKRYRAVVRHLHLVDCDYACLTHVGIKTHRAQGQNKSKKVLRLEPISKLKDRMLRILWRENVKDVITAVPTLGFEIRLT